MSWTCCEHVVNMSWTCHEHVVNMSWTSCEHVVNMSWTCCEQVVNMPWTCCEHVVNMLWKCCEQVVNMPRTCCKHVMKHVVNISGRVGVGFLRRSKRRRHLPKIRPFFWTDRQTDIVVYREVTLPKTVFTRYLNKITGLKFYISILQNSDQTMSLVTNKIYIGW